MDLKVKIGGQSLSNPIGVASGTYGYGIEYKDYLDLSIIGAIYTKALTLLPREGNAPPRIIETPSGMLNSIGLANVGVDAFITEKMPQLKPYSCAVIANIAGSTEREYLQVVERLEGCKGIWGYEINISCPNVSHGGMAFGTDPAVAEKLTQSIRKTATRPLIIKLSPNVTDISAIAKAVENGGADAVSCINTLVGMVIDTSKKEPVLANKTGGLSGPAIRPVGVALTYMVKKAVKIPVIGMGGIMTADDAVQYLLAGASAIQIGTANFVDTQTPLKVLDGIREYCKRENIGKISDFHQFIE
ncbi:MAG: dihydroorotate dehydrogenase [Spirochaetales bacterium]|nr:dihydroorotate dehydrogenase [Spirochaetales bacterium]